MNHRKTCSTPLGNHDVSTSEGGRGYVAEYFEKRLGRRDFTKYIGERLAADFACALAKHLQGSPEEQTLPAAGERPDRVRTFLLGQDDAVREKEPGASVIDADEPHGYLISVVVGAGVYRPVTIAGLFSVQGSGGTNAPFPRRVEAIYTVLNSQSEDLLEMARTVYNVTKELSNCSVIVDVGGNGIHFVRLLESLGTERVIRSNWGSKASAPEHQARFSNLRAQCNVHAAEALRAGRLMIGDHAAPIEQASKIPLYFDGLARYCLTPKSEMRDDTSAWDVAAMSFLENADYVPANPANGVPCRLPAGGTE